MEFKRQLASYKQDIDQALVKFFDKKIKGISKENNELRKFIRVLAEFTLRKGAKRIRGALAMVGYELFGGKKKAEIKKLAVAMELIQSYLLIHDDIMDRDDVRRGGPTAHKFFEKLYKKNLKYDHVHLGISLAILLGDISDAYTVELLSSLKFSAEKKTRIIQIIYRNIIKTAEGQMLDLLGCKSEQDIKRLNEIKTSFYTFVNPLTAGAILAGASQSSIRLLGLYGRSAGVAFQVRNDQTEVMGRASVIGKSLGSDIKEGRMTLLMFETLKRATQAQQREIKQIWQSRKVTPCDIKRIQEMVVKTGALEYNQKIAHDLVKKAKRSLQGLRGVNFENKEFLLDLADYVIIRDK